MPTMFGSTTKSVFLNEWDDLSLEFTASPSNGAITFAGDLITSNKVNLEVNGVAMAEVTFSVDHATTMGLIAAAIADMAGVKSATVTAARVITVVMHNDPITFNPILPYVTNVKVTAGGSQTTATTAVAPNAVHQGMPVKLAGSGEQVLPLGSGGNQLDMIGVVIVPPIDDEFVTVGMRAAGVIFAQAAAAVVPGPAKYAGYDTTTGYNKVDDGSVTHENIIGWILDEGAEGDIVRLAIKY